MNYRILVASYSNEIVTLGFDSESRTLTALSSVTVGHHPSWITPHTEDPSVYFTALEQPDGLIISLKYDADGKGEIISRVPSLGQDPCTLIMTGGDLLVGNYSSGSVTSVPVFAQSPFLTSSDVRVQLKGSGPNQDRQLSPHPHQVIAHPDRDEVLVPDLGSDKTWRLAKCGASWEVRGYIGYEPGSGPRHLAFYGENVYTLAELTSTVIAHRLPPLPSDPTFLTSIPTKANPLPLPNDMLAAEILIPKLNASFPTPYLYVSNRNDPSPEGDTIAIFSIADDKLELINEVPTGLNHVRGIVFGGEDSKWLIAGGVIGNGVKIYERVDGGRGLNEIASLPTVQAPTGFVWI